MRTEMSYMDQSPVSCVEYQNDHAGSWLRAAFVIGGGSALLWGLIIYAIWRLI
jgi:hypothetical protein